MAFKLKVFAIRSIIFVKIYMIIVQSGCKSIFFKSKKISHPDMEKALCPLGSGESGDFSLFGEDTGPQLYHPPNNLVTKPVIAKNLPKIFENLPVYGKPDNGISLSRFNKNKLKMFLGVTEKQFREISKVCSPDQLRIGNEVTVESDCPDPLLMNVHAEPKIPLGDDKDLPALKIFDVNKERHEDDAEGRYLRKALKYKNVHIVPLEQQAKTLNMQPPSERVTEPTLPAPPRKSKKSGKNKKNKGTKSSASANIQTKTENTPPAAPDLGVNLAPDGPDENTDVSAREAARARSDVILEPGRDILIKIRIYKPFDYEEYKNKQDGSLANLFYHDMVLCGRNFVSDIKDNFMCCEKGSTKESSRNGFLFIKNGFYVDASHEKAADHADSLRQWCSKREFGDFPKFDMRTCRLDDLEYKLGNPDVYIHDSSCEHIIIFSEIRLLNARDVLYMADYPRVISKSLHEKSPFCYNCVELNPKWIVSGCTRLPYNMAFFCQSCLRSLLYDVDGKKICKFKAYPYKGAIQNA